MDIQLFARDIAGFGEVHQALLSNARVVDNFTKAVLDEDRRHFELIGREQGIFSVENRPWRGRVRQIKMAIYRWLPDTETDSDIEKNTHKLRSIRRTLMNPSSMEGTGITIKTSSGESVFEWLSPFFNPSGVAGETLQYRKQRNPIDQDFSERLLRSSIRSDVEHGLWWFEGKSKVGCRVMELERWDSDHFLSGAVFGEVSEHEDQPKPQSVVFDELPPGTMMSMTLVPQSKKKAQERINTISRAAVGDEAELVEVRERCAQFTNELQHQPLWRGQIAFYIQGGSVEAIDAATDQLRDTFNRDGLALRFVQNSDQVSPLDSYLRWLPMNYHYQDDARFWYCGWYFLHDLLALSPLFGRANGTNALTLQHFNRGGELFGVDPLTDYKSNGHLNLFGPSGSGKSATLVGTCLRLLAMHRPRLFIIEAGNSFGLMADFCEHHNLTVHRVSIGADSKALMAPFADALQLIEPDVDLMLSEHELDVEIEHLNDNDSDFDEQRDILGELEIMARLMITGGDEQEMQDYRRADAAMVREAIVYAAQQCKSQQCQVRPEHVMNALMTFSEQPSRTPERRARAAAMGEAMTLFCQGMEGNIFNQEALDWPESDVTLIDLKLFARTGYEAQMATAYISLINRINAIAERDQYTGRHIVTLTDEAHLISTNPLLAPYAVKIVKMWRKLNAWFWLATQDIADFPDIAKKMLNNAEWWMLLNMGEDELGNLTAFKKLSEEKKNLIRSMTSEKHKFKEGVILGQDNTIFQRFRIVPPALYLALGETDAPSKEKRQALMDKHGITELEATLLKAKEIEDARASYQGEGWS
ncbi:conjugative transfer ATPase [Vibrio sp. 10N.261.46.A3]|uniref:conjugative transfer ATPase n=1 Tax=Vibrio sp. 10N.261.46.A3 TaxID=3229658 RepID=UPI00354F1233